MGTSIKLLFIFAAVALANFQLFSQDMEGWLKAGSRPDQYQIGTADEKHDGKTVYYINSTTTPIDGFGTIMTVIKPGDYFGKRVKMTGYIKTSDVVDHAAMWMRVDGKNADKSLGFDNMSNRPIKGTNDWTKYEIVLDVPAESIGIAYGVLIRSTGNVWLSGLSFEVVGDDVPVTNMP